MPSPITLEICANSVDSALNAQKGGAHRVELCDNLSAGGTTPSYGSIIKARELLQIKLYPIIRPRGGDFLYNDLEFELMQKNIEMCKRIGCDGVVIGLLTSSGKIDKERTRHLVDLAKPLGVTFHRAFDRCVDPLEGMKTIIETGCERILTSGQQPTAPEGIELISQLVEKAAGRLTIMPGSGIRKKNIADVLKKTGAKAIHTTAKAQVQSSMKFKSSLEMDNQSEELKMYKTSTDLVKQLLLKAGHISNSR